MHDRARPEHASTSQQHGVTHRCAARCTSCTPVTFVVQTRCRTRIGDAMAVYGRCRVDAAACAARFDGARPVFGRCTAHAATGVRCRRRALRRPGSHSSKNSLDKGCFRGRTRPSTACVLRVSGCPRPSRPLDPRPRRRRRCSRRLSLRPGGPPGLQPAVSAPAQAPRRGLTTPRRAPDRSRRGCVRAPRALSTPLEHPNTPSGGVAQASGGRIPPRQGCVTPDPGPHRPLDGKIDPPSGRDTVDRPPVGPPTGRFPPRRAPPGVVSAGSDPPSGRDTVDRPPVGPPPRRSTPRRAPDGPSWGGWGAWTRGEDPCRGSVDQEIRHQAPPPAPAGTIRLGIRPPRGVYALVSRPQAVRLALLGAARCRCGPLPPCSRPPCRGGRGGCRSVARRQGRAPQRQRAPSAVGPPAGRAPTEEGDRPKGWRPWRLAESGGTTESRATDRQPHRPGPG